MSDDLVLSDILRRVRSRWIAAARLRAATRGMLAASGIVLGAVVLERLVPIAAPLLLMLMAVVLAACLGITGWALWPYRRRPSDPQVARFIEERCPELEDRLASAVAPTTHGAFRSLVVRDAAKRISDIDIDRCVSTSRVRKSGAGAVAALAGLTAALWFALPPVQRASAEMFPGNLTIHVEPGDAKVRAGKSLRIVARVVGAREAVLQIERGGQWRDAQMVPDAQGFVAVVPDIVQSFRYRVAARSARSSAYTVTALRVPGVDKIDLVYRYPAYTGLKDRVEEDGGDIYAPPGTRIELTISTDKPVRTGTLHLEDGRRLDLTSRTGTQLMGHLTVDDDGSYRVALADLDGLANPGDTEYFIRTMDDRPPQIRIVRPAGDKQVTPLEEVRIEAEAEDDYGLDRVELVYAVRGASEKVVPLGGGRGATNITASHLLYLEDLKVSPGDFVTYYARARDVSRAKRSTEARSDIFFLEVKPFDEEFAAAQSQAGAGGSSGLESLIQAQKEIIIATWKLDRRSAAGKSRDDVHALAQAQGELKARAQQTAARMGGRREPRRLRGMPGTTPAGGPSDNPIARAAEAMARAETALSSVDIPGAVPHEMEALNQLLKADADIRRRQVAQQQNGAGGGGMGRSGQDLSTLFDRELQRQQQTNYENRAGSQQEEQPAESDALSKVRELARRQDELNRRQKELAEQRASMSDEEMKRQLERLTREQSELRKQAEELSRHLARQNGQQAGQRSEKSGEGQQGDDRMRDISEEMRSAASELRRGDAQGASAKGSGALDKLRELERQLQRGNNGGRRRSLGDMQLEARQLADAQRRLGAEASRTGQGAGGGDALRRMAGEKERLADRADQLQERVRELQKSGDPTDRQALSEALRELERQKIGERMRQSASALRERAGGGGAQQDPKQTASAEEGLTRGLERVADKLSAAADGRDAESQKLAEQMSRVRELKDRLTDLEHRIEQLARGESSDSQTGKPQSAQDRSAQAPSNGSKSGQPQTGEQQAGAQPQDGQTSMRAGQQGGSASSGDGKAQQNNSSPDQRGSGAGEISALRTEYDRQLREAEDLLKGMNKGMAGMGGTPEQHEYTAAAPGTEAFKQDFAKWDSLRKGVNLALEKLQASLSDKLADRALRDRLKAGGDERLPDAYRHLVEKYYESLARKRP